MGRIVFCLVALLAAAAPVALRAQPVMVPAPPVVVPARPSYLVMPPAPNSPLQQQMLQNYRSDLRQTQRELQLQQPPGMSREQIDVTHRLNAVNRALDPVSPACPARHGAAEPVRLQ